MLVFSSSSQSIFIQIQNLLEVDETSDVYLENHHWHYHISNFTKYKTMITKYKREHFSVSLFSVFRSLYCFTDEFRKFLLSFS